MEAPLSARAVTCGVVAALAVLSLSACTDAHPAARRPAATRADPTGSPLATGVAPATRAKPASCQSPPRRSDQFHARHVTADWRKVTPDSPSGFFRQGNVSADGSLLTVQDPGGIGEVRRLTGDTLEPVPTPWPGKSLGLAASGERLWVLTGAGQDKYGLGSREAGTWYGGPLASGGVDVDGRGPWVMAGDRTMRWDGRAWRHAPLPDAGASLTGTTQAPWTVLEEEARAPLAQWTGRAWRLVRVPGVKGKWVQLSAVVPTRPGEFWALGMVKWDEEDAELEPLARSRLLALRWKAGRWSCLFGPTDEEGNARFTDAVHDGRDGLWAVTHDGELWHLTDGRWTRERPRETRHVMNPDTAHADIMELAASEDGRHVYALGRAVWRLGQ
ncbi:hypothetical protein GCM10010149_23880 [Nonomuraea roseoviolacea subsp. roseoviolacea]|uniref:hypothetical protein n=1 Tax=Nonomuraea roseoviolacea TaxID=103837 RepID=UPI0031E12619